MDAFGGNHGEIARITFMNAMLGFIERRWPWDVAQDCICAKHLLDSACRVVCWGQILEHFSVSNREAARKAPPTTRRYTAKCAVDMSSTAAHCLPKPEFPCLGQRQTIAA